MQFSWCFFTCFFLLQLCFKETNAVGRLRCNSDEYQCSISGDCIHMENVCDGIPDCKDKSDETKNLCKHRSCSRRLDFGWDPIALTTSSNFRCNYGACIPSYFVCNGLKNCEDGSDETVQECGTKECDPVREFKCAYGACVSAFDKCNGRNDCVDGSDEKAELCHMHQRISCRSYQFRCSYGPCIHNRLKCNGRADCADNSDEVPSLCGENHTFRPATTISFELITTPKNPVTLPPTATPSKATTTVSIPVPSSAGNVGLDLQALLFSVLGGSEGIDPSILKAFGVENPSNSFPPWLNVPPGSPVIPDLPKETPVIPDLPKEAPVIPDRSEEKPKPEIRDSSGGDIMFPDPSSGLFPPMLHATPCAENLCRCDPPFDALCVTCQDKNMQSVCSKIGNDSVCSVSVEREDSVDILSCGVEFTSSSDVSNYKRVHLSGCTSGDGVPVLTTVLADCWGTTSMVLICQPDGKWLQYGETDSNNSMTRICQPSGMDSKICGRFKNLKRYSDQTPVNIYPFLVGIFDASAKFLCTGTIIASQWILTAGHCFPSYFQPTFNATSYRIQHALAQELENMTDVSEVYLHYNFSSTPYLTSDIALLKLPEKLVYSSELYPACVDRLETLFGQYAATFTRKEGENAFKWGLSRQILDASCFNRESDCSKHLEIGPAQFCSRQSDGSGQLKPGSSGGPYLINKTPDSDDRWTVAGIVSYEIDTKKCPAYIVYSLVHLHRSWLEDCIQNGHCK